MGYITNYAIQALSRNDSEYVQYIMENFPHYSLLVQWASYGNEELRDKYYDCYDEMKQLSSAFPEDKFILSGIGEEDFDNWSAGFHRGKEIPSVTQIVRRQFYWLDGAIQPEAILETLR